MQVQTISSQSPKSKINNNFKTLHNQSFKGGFDNTVIAVMDAIDRGGLFASFTTQDMLGTNLPRPIMGLRRNKKENQGKKNTTLALKEAIREFTTGPSMFAIPGAILFLSKRFIGKSLNIPSKAIHKMGKLFEDTVNATNAATPEKLKLEYYKNAFSNILSSSTKQSKKAIASNSKKMAEDLVALEALKHKPFIKKLKGTKTEGFYEDAMDSLVDKFMKLRKNSIKDVSNSFFSATIKTADGEATMPIEKLIKHVAEYADDAIGKTSAFVKNAASIDNGAVKNFIINFNNKRICQRFGLNILMSAAVISFLTIIPRLYNVSKDNPALRGLVTANVVAGKE